MLFGLGGARRSSATAATSSTATPSSTRPDGMTVGDLMVFTAYLGMLWGPLCTLTGFAANVQGGVAGVRARVRGAGPRPVIADAPDAVPLPLPAAHTGTGRVGFAYRPRGTDPESGGEDASGRPPPVLDGRVGDASSRARWWRSSAPAASARARC